MSDQSAVQKILFDHFQKAKVRNPAFTLRAFARKLGLNSGALSGILNGKRRVSTQMVERICDRLMLEPEEKKDLIRAFSTGARTAQRDPMPQIGIDEFKLIAEWYHSAILALVKTRGFQNDTDWIARKLGIPKQTARNAIGLLFRLGLIEIGKGGRVVRTSPWFQYPDDVSTVAARKSHEQTLSLVQASLDRDPVEMRECVTDTLAIELKSMGRAKKLIHEFREDFSEQMETGNQAEVYRLCIQFIPLSKLK